MFLLNSFKRQLIIKIYYYSTELILGYDAHTYISIRIYIHNDEGWQLTRNTQVPQRNGSRAHFYDKLFETDSISNIYEYIY